MVLAFPDFEKANILIVGDIMLDRYWSGATMRISPEAPVPVVRVQDQTQRPGGAANVALNIAALGAQVQLLGVIGTDEAGEHLKTILKARCVHFTPVLSDEDSTITKLRIVSQNQQLIRLDFEKTLTSFSSEQLMETYQAALSTCDVVLLSDYGKGTIKYPGEFIEAARKMGKPILVDPKGNSFEPYRGATLLTPNRRELESVVGACPDEATLLAKGQVLVDSNLVTALLVTRSQEGMSLLRKGCAPVHQAARVREVYDVTGAGDTVIGVFAAALAADQDMVSAMYLSNLAAGIVVGRAGAAQVTVSQLRRRFFNSQGFGQGILTQEQLHIAVQDAKAHGEKIVMTNGCFDVLHMGHVQYLMSAKALGDKLVVAVNTDESVQTLKGPTRPINTLARRMAVLSGLEAVDWVVPFAEETPAALIESILPDVLVKGGDYQVKDIAGANVVMNNGGEVKILEFVEHCSTTQMIESILEKEA